MEDEQGWTRVLRFLVCLLLPLLVGAAGGWATAQGVQDWYPGLDKPPFNPPSWVFGPVWTLLYLLMGVASFLVWDRGLSSPGIRKALILYGTQLVLNGLWSFVFFGARAPGWAFLELLLLLAFLIWTTVLFFRIRTLAGWLMTPYLLWVTFAGVLNFAIWSLNG